MPADPSVRLELDPRLGYDAQMMPRLTGVLIVLMLAATILPAAGDVAADLAGARSRLVDSTREYRASLERLLAIQEASATRADDTAALRRRLHERGILSGAESDESEGVAVSARAQVGEPRRRLAETLAAIELAGEAVATTTVGTTATMIGSRGDTDLSAAAVRDLDRFFVSRFARTLPVSALGQTPLHDRLGLDHRQALDVAVHPDSEEGRAVIEYLQRHRIPFLAFRGVVPGASTGAHVHVGRTSARVVPVSLAPR